MFNKLFMGMYTGYMHDMFVQLFSAPAVCCICFMKIIISRMLIFYLFFFKLISRCCKPISKTEETIHFNLRGSGPRSAYNRLIPWPNTATSQLVLSRIAPRLHYKIPVSRRLKMETTLKLKRNHGNQLP